MVRYILQQIKIRSSRAFGKWFAKNVVEETFNLDMLAEHMSSHNTPYSKGAIKGVLTDMIQCIKELLLEGKNVKIDGLAIFSLGIKNSTSKRLSAKPRLSMANLSPLQQIQLQVVLTPATTEEAVAHWLMTLREIKDS